MIGAARWERPGDDTIEIRDTGEVLEEISVFYAKALRDAIKTVTGMIEPIMIIIMGSIVGFIAMAIILPIFKMSAIVGG